ncbi:hypothetical protein [Enterococcus gilvus]|uniref:hypothetical protein n=1 Tax=Enterococcus gilvus TaxID=160453 RepID=UPI0029128D83|nr:hypothetical protein [Enterococcus gilvus]MDU5510517.1 hypothetical protein [Enterococcus gilvus]
MGMYRKKRLIGLFLLILIVLLLLTPLKKSADKTTTETTLSSVASSVAPPEDPGDPTAFLTKFSGKWRSEEIAQIIEFKQIEDVPVVVKINEKDPNEDGIIELKGADYVSSHDHWILTPLKAADFRYNLRQLSQNKIQFYSFTTKENSEGVSKPLIYSRVD